MGCSIDVENQFGPEVDGSCLGGFDFTLLFEETFLSIAPLMLVSIFLPFRLRQLAYRFQKIKTGRAYQAKLICHMVYGIVQFVTLFLIVSSVSGVQKTRATIPNAGFNAVIAILLLILSHFEHLRNIRPSSILTVYFGATAVFDAVRTRTLYSMDDNKTYAIVFSVSNILKITIFFLEALDKRSDLRQHFSKISKESTVGIFSRNFFWWLNPLLWTGYNNNIPINDLESIDERLESTEGHRAFHDRWVATNPKRPGSLIKLLISQYKWQLLFAVPSRLAQTGFTFAQPFLITRVSKFVIEPDTPLTGDIGFGLIAATAIIYAGLALTTANNQHKTYRVITAFRGSLVSLLYRGTLPLSSADVRLSSATTLMSADVERVGTGMRYMHEVWASPIDIGLAIWLLERQLGVAAVMPGAIFLLCSVIGVKVAVSMGARQRKWLEAIEKRVNVTSDMLSSMKEVRMSGLQTIMKTELQRLRSKEVADSKPFKNALVTIVTLSYTTAALAPIISFGMFTLLAKKNDTKSLNTENAFTSLALFALLRQPMTLIINALSGLMTAIGSLSRIGEYLCKEPRVDPRKRNRYDAPPAGRSPFRKASFQVINTIPLRSLSRRVPISQILTDNMIEAMNVSAGWEKDKAFVLKDLSFDIPRSGLTMVVGPVGTGKSTLLRAILGETTQNLGSIRVSFRHAAFCSQTPWIMNVSIRKNILGAGLCDKNWYNQVIDACMLTDDLSRMPNGDAELVGNNGSNLSGGQQARLAVARAIYAKKDIVLLDDVMSGLDAGTEDRMFNNLFGQNGLFRAIGTTVVYATNGLHRLSYAQHIIVLDGEGKIAEQGSYETLSSTTKHAQSAPLEYTEIAHPTNTDSGKTTLLDTASVQAPTGLDRRTGDSAVYKYYVRTVGWFNFAVFIGSCSLFIFALVFPQYLVKWWANANEKSPNHELGAYLGGYFALSCTAILALAGGCWHFVNHMMPRASTTFHDALLNSTLNAPQSFFGKTDVGETTNRFSQDLQLIDMELPLALFTTCVEFISCIAQFIMIAVSAKFLGAALPFVAVVFYFIQKFYLRTARQLRLLDIEAKVPLFSMFLEVLSGLVTIRAFGWEEEFDEKLLEALEVSQRPNYLLFCVQRWLNLVLDLVVWAIAIIVVTIATKTKGTLDPGRVGIALIKIINFGISIKQLISNWTTLEVSIGAVARVRAFAVEMESEHRPRESEMPPPAWPKEGSLEFSDITATYKGKEKPVINGLNLSILPGQKIAICGKSGSGKSSIISCLFRLLDPSEGTVIIDGMDTSFMPRQEIRSRLICVTQAPYLFAGTGRENLDPFGKCESMEIIQALEAVQMGDLIEELGGLDVPLSVDVMSLGQRQLLCLARAMLRRGSILVLDEATASLDHDTDDLVQKIIRTHFSKHTVIAIAHRLNTIIDFDRVAVVNAGELVEFDTPGNLLARKNCIFKDLYSVSAAGAQSRKDKATEKDGQLYEHSNINIGADGTVYDLSHATSSSANMLMFPVNSPITPVAPGGSWRQYAAEQAHTVMVPEIVPEEPGTDSEWEDYSSNEDQPSGRMGRSHGYPRIKHRRHNGEDPEEMQLWLKTQSDSSFLVSKSQRKGKQAAQPQSQVSNTGAPARMASTVSESFGRLKRSITKNYYNPLAG